MAMYVYCGLQGSGKSFEAVKSVIVPAIAQGRRVLTNIRNIRQDKIHALIERKALAKPEAPLGEIVPLTPEIILAPNFFFDPELLLATNGEVDSFVRPGDLVVIDEAWETHGPDRKLSEEHKKFFRMHRHYAHPVTGVTCDLVFLCQDIDTSLNRFVKATIQQTFHMKKHTALAAIPYWKNRYVITIYEGHKMRIKDVISQYQAKYDKDYFGLYDSHVGGVGKEVKVDGRATLFTKKNALVFSCALLAPAAGLYGLYSVFAPYLLGDSHKPAAPQTKQTADASSSGLLEEKLSVGKSSSSGKSRVALVGYLSTGDNIRVLVRTPEGIQTVTPTRFVPDGFATSAEVDGQAVSFSSGSAKSDASLLGEALPK
ncbi:zonular occludens toxin domain-containing protein [Chromobacterium paludis]|uniref:Zona occludens toxin N-terminal domain-containing protein n=1 Tax=Chromobacterium paludis TaxID=2605945 RepID=A0A5C1DIH0_9NEIS|nr:zonular occludens toxin domain-containing protein [Chromobacterium paludis]QEL56464.1 hypothetical protein FYK34_13280 [Chromobacterium paludis]